MPTKRSSGRSRSVDAGSQERDHLALSSKPSRLAMAREFVRLFVQLSTSQPRPYPPRVDNIDHARLAAIVESSEDAIIGKTLEGVITDWNRAAETMFGYSAREAIGRTVFELIVPTELAPEEAAILAAVKRGEIVPRLTTRRQRRDGAQFPASVSVSPIRDADGRIVGAAKVLRDISLEIASREALESAARSQTEFLAAMSHELRTPLHSIIGFSSLMLESGELGGEAARRQARLIHEASQTLLSIVNDVLDISKLDASRIDLDPRPFSPRSLLCGVVDLLRNEAERRGLAIFMSLRDDMPARLVGDEPRLRQILLNLMSNALKFTAKGEVRIEAAAVAVASDTTEITFRVSDTGIGIPQSKAHRIFQRFSQVDGSTSRNYGGTGLGLYLCKGLVEMMGGSIGFESQEGVGSQFWFTVPLATAHASSASGGEALDSPGPTRSARILVAEDVEINQELAVLMLRKLGHVVDVVSDGGAAIDAVRRNAYDLVLMDIQMPTLDGFEATARIRAMGGAYSTLPIVAATAATMTEDIAKYKLAGMDDHISKPFVASQLSRIINLRSLRRAAAADETVSLGEPAPSSQNEADGASRVLDEAAFDRLANQIGAEKAASLVRRFAQDLARRFAQPDEPESLRKDAHAIASSARALGFLRLSTEAKALEDACRGKSEVEMRRTSFFASRTEASQFIKARFP